MPCSTRCSRAGCRGGWLNAGWLNAGCRNAGGAEGVQAVMSEPRRSGAGAAAAVVLLVVSGTALAGAVLLFLTAVGPGRSDPHGYSMIFSAIIGLVSAPVFLLALALVFGRRHPWVSLAVNIFLSLLSMGLGLLLVSSVVEAWSHTGRVGLTLLVPGCALLLLGAVIAGSSLLGAIRTWRRTRRQRRAGATDTGPWDA